jgi:hypothetical protein
MTSIQANTSTKCRIVFQLIVLVKFTNELTASNSTRFGC